MKTRKLGSSDMEITPIGFGAWAIGGAGWEYGWGAQDDRQSVAAIHRALEAGINWIDTAAAYGLGQWTGPRPCVFTKCGLPWNERGELGQSLRGSSIRAECEGSLRRLRTEAIDLYQIHWPTDTLAETEEGWATLARLKEEGKVRWIGVSNFSVRELEAARGIAPVTSLQPPYSLIRRDIEAEVLPFCQAHGIGVIGYSPMASGLLTGAMTRERAAALPADDWRRRRPDFQEPALSKNLALAERLRAVGARHGHTAGETAIAWTLHHPAVTGAIVGARSAAQVDGILGAADFRLSAAEIAEIEAG